MKADCIGEFEFTIQAECGECIDTGADDDCEVCQGGIQYERKVTVPWDTCKQIYKRMAEIAAAGVTLRNEQWDYRVYLKWAESVIEKLDPNGIGMLADDLAKEAMVLPNPRTTQLTVPEGWKLVPWQLNEEMVKAFNRADAWFRNGIGQSPDTQWRQMLKAAPQPPTGQEGA
jgi:hypothetical protein